MFKVKYKYRESDEVFDVYAVSFQDGSNSAAKFLIYENGCWKKEYDFHFEPYVEPIIVKAEDIRCGCGSRPIMQTSIGPLTLKDVESVETI